jgi:hypothetical protein
MLPFGKDLLIKDGLKLLVDNKEEMETIRIIQEMRDTQVMKNGKLKNPTFKEIAEYLTKEKRKNKFGTYSWFIPNVRKYYFNNDYRSGKRVPKIEEKKERDLPETKPVLTRQKGYSKLREEENEEDIEEENEEDIEEENE